MNLFGFDVQRLDVPALVTRVHGVWWVLCALSFLYLVSRARRSEPTRSWRLIVGLAIAGHALAWFVTMFPLPNVYGLNASKDRENHLGWTQVIVAGNSPIRSSQVNQLSFEPLWPNLAALASFYRADRVDFTFQIAPLVAGILFVLSVYICVSRGLGGDEAAKTEAAFGAFFALLLASSLTDQTAPFQNSWALTFLLKPNHALGLVLMPWVVLAVTRAKTWGQRLFSGFLLQVLGWAFVIHMAYVISGFLVFVALSWLMGRPERRQNTIDVAVAIGVNLVVVSPYLYMLVEAFSSLGTNPRFGLAPQSAHTLEATLRPGLVFPLALFGTWSLLRGPSRFGQALGAQFIAAHVNWQIYHGLGWLQLGREMDEAQYWVRFMSALVAGIGFARLGQIAAARLPRFAPRVMARGFAPGSPAIAAVLLAIAATSAIPDWWDPPTMDRYFSAALAPQPARVEAAAAFLRNRTDGHAVVAGDRSFARYVAAFGGRRVLISESLNPPRDIQRRAEVEAAIAQGLPRRLIDEGRARYGIRYLLVTPAFLAGYRYLSLGVLDARSDLRRVFDFGAGEARITIFELVE
jgi:hypothetical protein